MRELALSDEILLQVEKPARYIGNEINAVMKNKEDVAIRFAICFPDVYEIGMSHLGMQILYHILNQQEDVWCERVYSPWHDLHTIMQNEQIPLFALESQEPIKEFDFLGITVQYEMCYTNILQILDLSQIPRYSHQRTEKDPIVIGGGPCTYNPEPLALFFDLFYIGEAEASYEALLRAYRRYKEKGLRRKEFLEMAAQIEGIYVPSFYDVIYHQDGTIASFTPNNPYAPDLVRKVVVPDMKEAVYPTKPVVPFIQVTQDRGVLEIQRGCIRGCRFCQAGMVYRPTRERDVEDLKNYAKQLLDNTGYDEISLSSLSSSDYSGLEELIAFLIDEFQEKKVNISLPSLRIDDFSLKVMRQVQDVRKSSLTFAPEAGTQRLRNVVNKGLTEEVILSGAREAFAGGWTKVKLYFMLGLPTETVEDQREIARLSERIARCYYERPKEERGGRCQIIISTSFFVPKPFTSLQWVPMYSQEEYIRRAMVVKEEVGEQLNLKSMKYNWHQADVTILEGAFARGDRKLSAAIEEAYRLGSLYDAWSESFDYHRWLKAFENTGIDLDFYTTRERSLEETLPWDFIDIGVTKEYLKKEWENALSETKTMNCKEQCNGCGAAVFKGGVCFESKN